jgi:hypothetical protein
MALDTGLVFLAGLPADIGFLTVGAAMGTRLFLLGNNLSYANCAITCRATNKKRKIIRTT